MKVIALTGGIASGKSTVARMLADLGAELIDADVVAREVVEPGQPALAEIAAAFGDVLKPDGRLDRNRLAAAIFPDDAARRRLNAIVHPRVRERMRATLREIARARPSAIVVLDIPLLFESPPPEFVPGDVIVVYAGTATQIDRLIARDGVSREEALRRLSAQRPLAEKLARARWMVDNGESPESTRNQVERIWRAILDEST
ncbi:MAG: dephospho-CoA kinase [Armatimonadetes bacterium]|nr:dephospho-CoA kinase [Armatimonadota bacterium]